MTEPFVTENSGDQELSGGQLRKLLEDQIKLNKNLQKQLDEMKSADVERAVADTWDNLKVPEGLRKGYRGDETPEAIASWWKDISPFVNVQSGGDDAGTQPQATTETDEQREQRQQIQATQRASGLGGDFASSVEEGIAKGQELRARGSAITQAELDDVFNKLGIK